MKAAARGISFTMHWTASEKEEKHSHPGIILQ